VIILFHSLYRFPFPQRLLLDLLECRFIVNESQTVKTPRQHQREQLDTITSPREGNLKTHPSICIILLESSTARCKFAASKEEGINESNTINDVAIAVMMEDVDRRLKETFIIRFIIRL
jgi:hypothetical protein